MSATLVMFVSSPARNPKTYQRPIQVSLFVRDLAFNVVEVSLYWRFYTRFRQYFTDNVIYQTHAKGAQCPMVF